MRLTLNLLACLFFMDRFFCQGKGKAEQLKEYYTKRKLARTKSTILPMLIRPKHLNLQEIQKHVLCWTAFISYELVVAYSFSGKFSSFFDYCGHYLLNIGTFYLTVFFTFEIASKKNKNRVILLLLLINAQFALYVIVKGILAQILLYFGVHQQQDIPALGAFLIQSLWRFIYFVGMAAGFWFAQSKIRQNVLIAELEKKQLVSKMEKEELEKTLLLAENSYLKAQINPHFLYNALGFIHHQVYKVSSSAGETVILLANMMQYALRNSQGEELVSLESEIEHIQSYIEINQQRFVHSLNLLFFYEGDIERAMIIPLLFLTIIENVFKYGKLINVEEPATIKISATEKQLKLQIKNQKNNKQSSIESGIGMSNVIKRLDLHYKNRHELWIKNSEDRYQLNLTIYL